MSAGKYTAPPKCVDRYDTTEMARAPYFIKLFGFFESPGKKLWLDLTRELCHKF